MSVDVRIVFQPEQQHRCGPNSYGIWLDTLFEPPGTVRECACGKSWVAYKDRADAGYVGVKWRREGWLARRRRIKKKRRV